MDTKQSNPYETPKVGELLAPDSKPVLPPITLPRLVIGLILITVGWMGLWARVREDMRFGLLIAPLCVVALVWVIEPGARRRKGPPLKRRDILMMMLICGGASGLVSFFKETKPGLPWLEGALVHPGTLITGWFACCGGLLLARWKRRNNPPYQKEDEANG